MKYFKEYCNLIANAKIIEDKTNIAKQNTEQAREADSLRTLINAYIENTEDTYKAA